MTHTEVCMYHNISL